MKKQIGIGYMAINNHKPKKKVTTNKNIGLAPTTTTALRNPPKELTIIHQPKQRGKVPAMNEQK